MPIFLEKEYQFYIKHMRHLSAQHLNEFVVIKGLHVFGFYKTYEDALDSGIKQFGNVPFFIKEVKPQEEPLIV